MRKFIALVSSPFTRAPITPSEVTRRFSNIFDLTEVLRKGYKNNGMCAALVMFYHPGISDGWIDARRGIAGDPILSKPCLSYLQLVLLEPSRDKSEQFLEGEWQWFLQNATRLERDWGNLRAFCSTREVPTISNGITSSRFSGLRRFSIACTILLSSSSFTLDLLVDG